MCKSPKCNDWQRWIDHILLVQSAQYSLFSNLLNGCYVPTRDQRVKCSHQQNCLYPVSVYFFAIEEKGDFFLQLR